MVYSQKELLALIKAGAVPDERGVPEHIETVISNVFLFKKHGYKIYKNNNEFFNAKFRDLSDHSARLSFTKRDFEWNHALSPSVYIELIGVRVTHGKIEICAEHEADELVIKMNRMDTRDIVFSQLARGTFSQKDAFLLGKEVAHGLRKVQKKVSGHNLYEAFRKRIVDVVEWMQAVTEYLPTEEATQYTDYIEKFRIDNREWFETTLTDEMTVDGDFHTHNVLSVGDSFVIMDSFAPKDEWAIGHYLTPIYRIGADLLALGGDEKLFESYLRGYEEGSGKKVNRTIDPFLIMYASLIAVSYLYQLQKNDPAKLPVAKQFHTFLRTYFEKLSSGS